MGTVSVYDTCSPALTFLLIVLSVIFHICASMSYMRVIMVLVCAVITLLFASNMLLAGDIEASHQVLLPDKH